jgi:transposase
MAGTFEGLTDLEWKLFADVFPPLPKRSRGMPHTPFRQVVNTLLYVLITGCRWCDLPRGPHGRPRVRPIGGCSGGTPMARPWLCKPGSSGLPRHRGWFSGRMAPLTAPSPPGTGGGEGVARGGQGQGILIHSLTDAAGMPLANRTTPAHGHERAQVLPLLDAVRLRTGKPGRPRKRPKVLATDKGDDAKGLRLQLRTRGMRAQIPKRVWQTKTSRGRPIKMAVPRFQAERTLAWFRNSTAARSSAGSGVRHASRRFWPLPRSISGCRNR